MLGGMYLARELEALRRRREEAFCFELLVRDTHGETVVAPVAKIRSKPARKLPVDRNQYDPCAVSPASIEMLPAYDARESRHKLGREFMRARVSPQPSQQAQGHECAPLARRQPEEDREAMKQI